MNFCLASLATKVLREKSCKVKSCVLRDARLVPTIIIIHSTCKKKSQVLSVLLCGSLLTALVEEEPIASPNGDEWLIIFQVV